MKQDPFPGPSADECSDTSFLPPPFRPSRLYLGGHLQTLGSLRAPDGAVGVNEKHVVTLADGDAIVLHESVPVDGRSTFPPEAEGAVAGASQESSIETAGRGAPSRSVVLFHGLSGCHGSPYMIRLTAQFLGLGFTVFRVDMRGCGDARDLARGISHAGRSEDISAALSFVAGRHPRDQMAAIGVSLGGNQLLRYAGRVGGGMDPRPDWFGRLRRLAAVAPPIDLVRCSANMQRWSRRVYNRFFIRGLLDRLGPAVRERDGFVAALSEGKPRTLLELDERLTAPLSGFRDAADYYGRAGAVSVVSENPIPTLVLAAEDDPIVPVDCIRGARWPRETELIVTRTGGHAGYVGRRGHSWMDECLVAWTKQF